MDYRFATCAYRNRRRRAASSSGGPRVFSLEKCSMNARSNATQTINLDQIRTGWKAYDAKSEKIGDVIEVGSNYVLVQKGWLLPMDLYIPLSSVTSVDPDNANFIVDVTKENVETLGWDNPPADANWDARATNDSFTVPVREERVEAKKHARDAGQVTVDKHVVEQQQELDVPVTHEEVDVTRRRVDRPLDSDDTIADDGETIRVPLRAEDVDVRKDARVVEEVEISKRPVTETQRVSETVRREEIDVDETKR
jgi:uncharacterized protein (TIGR02271 family)